MDEWFVPEWLLAFLIALVFASLVEYWGHRAMHTFLMRKKHAEHHREGDGQGWLGEFWDYFVGTLPLMWFGFLWSVEAGIGFAAGGIGFAAWAAYNHQIQHENPELCFWLRRPVHYLHHRDKMWKTNFGISSGVWDRVFGTYKYAEWNPQKKARDYPVSSFFRIKWI
jgi:sterol desaturase/sphingolipid hydroxylase (fatty acid hydroxylase superfamily)